MFNHLCITGKLNMIFCSCRMTSHFSQVVGVRSGASSEFLRCGEPSTFAFVGHRYVSSSRLTRLTLIPRREYRSRGDMPAQWRQDRRSTGRSLDACAPRLLARLHGHSPADVLVSTRTAIESDRNGRRPRHDCIAQVNPSCVSLTCTQLHLGRPWAITSTSSNSFSKR